MNFRGKLASAFLGSILSAFALTAEEAAQPLLTALSSTTISGYVDVAAQWNPGSGNSAPAPSISYGTEILLQNQEGSLATLVLSGTQLFQSSLLVPNSNVSDPRIAVASVKGSIYFQQSDLFLKDNSAIRVLPVVPIKNLAFAGAANLAGSQDADLVWASKWTMLIWEMDGTRVTRQHLLKGPFHVSANAKVVGIDDFDGNNSLDFLWQDPQGPLWVTLMDRRMVRGTVILNNGRPANLKWSPRGTADFNFDGKADVLWQHEDGRIATWLMDGTVRVASKLLIDGCPVAAGWKIVDANTVFYSAF